MAEVLVSALIFAFVIISTIMIHFYGTRLNEVSKARLGVGSDARRALSALVEEVRSAVVVQVGQGDVTSFTPIPPNTLQLGNAIQVYVSTNTNSFIRYFYDEADQTLKRITNGASPYMRVASYVTNSAVFSAEDFQGMVVTNDQNNRVISLTLQFAQLDSPFYTLASNKVFNSYQLRTSMRVRNAQ
jgi:hypothetical protein